MTYDKKLPSTSSTFNPLDFICKESATAIDDCNSLANALVVRSGEEKDPHWNDSAEAGIAALTALTVYYGMPGARSLQRVDEILNSPKALESAVTLMCQPDDSGEYPWAGMLARLGGRMSHWTGDEKGSVLSSMARHLSFLRSPAMSANTQTTSFDPAKLVKGKLGVFVVPPLEYPLIPWVRMVIDGMLKAVMRCGLQESRKVHGIIDEAASLGPMDAIRHALDKGAGFGLRLQLYYQSVGQLNRCWPNGEVQSLLAQTARVYFSVGDLQTATEISNSIGKATIVVESGGWNRGGSRSTSEGHGHNQTHGTSWGESRNWSQAPREIFKPEEIMTLPPRTAITFPGGGMAPVVTTLLRWFEEPWLTKKRKWLSRQWEAISVLARSLMVLLLMSMAAYCVTEFAKKTRAFEKFDHTIQTLTKGGRR